MATKRPEVEKLLYVLRKRVTREDLDWLSKANSKGYKNYKELIEPKDDLAKIDNSTVMIYSIQYLIDAIKREIAASYQYADIPKDHVRKFAEILGLSIPKKFNKRDVIAQILDNAKKATA